MDFSFVVQETGGSSHHDEVFERITHPALRRVIDVVLVFSGFAMGFVMLAGAGANLEQQFGLPAWAGSALCAVLVILTAFLDFDRIMKVIGVFTPMIIVAITILTIYSLATPHPSVAELNTAATTRWQGRMRSRGLRPTAPPIAWADAGTPASRSVAVRCPYVRVAP